MRWSMYAATSSHTTAVPGTAATALPPATAPAQASRPRRSSTKPDMRPEAQAEEPSSRRWRGSRTPPGPAARGTPRCRTGRARRAPRPRRQDRRPGIGCESVAELREARIGAASSSRLRGSLHEIPLAAPAARRSARVAVRRRKSRHGVDHRLFGSGRPRIASISSPDCVRFSARLRRFAGQRTCLPGARASSPRQTRESGATTAVRGQGCPRSQEDFDLGKPSGPG